MRTKNDVMKSLQIVREMIFENHNKIRKLEARNKILFDYEIYLNHIFEKAKEDDPIERN